MTDGLKPPPSRVAPWGGAVRRWFDHLCDALNACGTLWIIALMLLVNADVIGRTGFNAPVRGVTEILALSIVGIVFLQLASTQRTGRLTRADALLNRLRPRLPRLAAALDTTAHLAGAILLFVLCWASIPYFERAWERNEYVGALGDFTAPTWPIRLIILVGSFLAGLQFLLQAADRGRALVQPHRHDSA